MLSIGTKLIGLYAARAARGIHPLGAALNAHNKWHAIADDEDEMNGVTSTMRTAMYRRWVCANRAALVAGKWTHFPNIHISDTRQLLVRTDGMNTVTSWVLYRGARADGWGELYGRCEQSKGTTKYCIKDRRFLWQWYDEMDANAYNQGASAVEGWVDIMNDGFPKYSSFMFTVTWRDDNPEHRCFECN